MRTTPPRIALLGTCALTLVCASALADDKPPDPDAPPPGEIVSIAEVRDELAVLQANGGAHFIAIVPMKLGSDHFYFGDGARMHQQRAFSGGANAAEKSFSRAFWDPRTNHRAEIALRGGTWTLTCGKRKTVLEEASEADRARVLDGHFLQPLWKRVAYALARDKRGNYYYVDRIRDDPGTKGFRLFVGPKGRLKPTKLVNIVSDSEGDIFSTRKGELRLVVDKNATTWHKGKQTTQLTTVPLQANVYLIYAELGVYDGEPLGTPLRLLLDLPWPNHRTTSRSLAGVAGITLPSG